MYVKKGNAHILIWAINMINLLCQCTHGQAWRITGTSIIFQRIWHYNEETTYLPSWPFTAWSVLWLRLELLGRRSFSSGVTKTVLLRNGGGVSIFSSMSLPGIETSDKRFMYGLRDGSSVVDDLSLLELEGFLGLSKIISSELLDSSPADGLSSLACPSKLSAKRWTKNIIQISSFLKIIWSNDIKSATSLLQWKTVWTLQKDENI